MTEERPVFSDQIQRERELQMQREQPMMQQQMMMQDDAANGVVCPKCGTVNEPEAQFCASCGEPLHMATCPNCGSEIDPDADYCEVCHHYIRQDVCSFCGADFNINDGYCPQCGMPRGGIVCPACHTLNDFSFCKQCGQPLTAEAKAILAEMRQLPEYKELMSLSHEYNELQMQLPYETVQDKERGDDLHGLRERVLRLLAEDEGEEFPEIPAPHKKRVTKEELQEAKQKKLDQLAELLSRMTIPPHQSPAKVRNFAMAQKPAGVRLAWKCNYKQALHSSPCGCAKPQMGGTWVILGHNSKQEIKDDK
ncbi:zinc ribbon domain-containing protein [Prevotella sp. E15-22]|uniref:zinc ribbon domain-containing protein n=1 Tax=Prevotella sp. E15-22 TaxID=2937774 RepID=UPI00206B607C|nr:zinc ribbon domain-containing protein [Prevotella sp. E15-22]UPS43395.1 zinc ribbon domain-containing protein [Prevotella sp. E15-22]